MRIELPFPPSMNTYWRRVTLPGRGVQTLISKPGREFRKAVVGISRSSVFLSQRLSVTLELFPPDRRARDIDNYAKAALDALTHAGLWGDDSQIDELRIVRRGVERGGRMVVHVQEAAPWPDDAA